MIVLVYRTGNNPGRALEVYRLLIIRGGDPPKIKDATVTREGNVLLRYDRTLLPDVPGQRRTPGSAFEVSGTVVKPGAVRHVRARGRIQKQGRALCGERTSRVRHGGERGAGRDSGLQGDAAPGAGDDGVGGLRLDPGEPGLGVAVSVAPAWGPAASGGTERLWQVPHAGALAAGGVAAAGDRLDAEVSYGVEVPGGIGLLTPYAGAGMAEAGALTWRAGTRMTVASGLNLGVEGTRSEPSAGAAAEHTFTVNGELRW